MLWELIPKPWQCEWSAPLPVELDRGHLHTLLNIPTPRFLNIPYILIKRSRLSFCTIFVKSSSIYSTPLLSLSALCWPRLDCVSRPGPPHTLPPTAHPPTQSGKHKHTRTRTHTCTNLHYKLEMCIIARGAHNWYASTHVHL